MKQYKIYYKNKTSETVTITDEYLYDIESYIKLVDKEVEEVGAY